MAFKQIEEAIALHNHALDRLDAAAAMTDPAARAKALTFVFVGGGYAGVEALGETEDMLRSATRYYPNVSADELRFVLVEAAGRILPEVGEQMGAYTVERLRQRGIEVRLNTLLKSAVDKHVVLSDGEEFDADTIVWTAGVKANPVLADSDLPLDDKGRIKTRTDLRVEGLDGVWAAGDNAAVPDLTHPGELTSPSAQHAVRQAKVLAANITRSLRGKAPKEYRHKHVGSVASLGLHKGVAQVYGVKLRGFPAWFMHRTYHMTRMPTFNKKVRVVLDWTLALVLPSRRRLARWIAPPARGLRAGQRADSDPPRGPRSRLSSATSTSSRLARLVDRTRASRRQVATSALPGRRTGRSPRR